MFAPVLIMARFDPVFVVPVASIPETTSVDSTSRTQKTGRGTGTGSANVSTPSNRPSMKRIPIRGFRVVSLLSIIRFSGNIPESGSAGSVASLESIRSSAGRPVAVFPECTTSKGRGVLRFADIFTGIPVPVRKFKVFVACFRCAFSPLSRRSSERSSDVIHRRLWLPRSPTRFRRQRIHSHTYLHLHQA